VDLDISRSTEKNKKKNKKEVFIYFEYLVDTGLGPSLDWSKS
jgi:hypothetical protein